MLCRLFNLSLELGTFPEKQNDANLVPIHKCESKTMLSNYRGILLLDVLSKILKRQVYNEIFGIICHHLKRWQHGPWVFRPFDFHEKWKMKKWILYF